MYLIFSLDEVWTNSLDLPQRWGSSLCHKSVPCSLKLLQCCRIILEIWVLLQWLQWWKLLGVGETGRAAVIIDNKVVSCDSDNIADTDPGADTFITECHHSSLAISQCSHVELGSRVNELMTNVHLLMYKPTNYVEVRFTRFVTVHGRLWNSSECKLLCCVKFCLNKH